MSPDIADLVYTWLEADRSRFQNYEMIPRNSCVELVNGKVPYTLMTFVSGGMGGGRFIHVWGSDVPDHRARISRDLEGTLTFSEDVVTLVLNGISGSLLQHVIKLKPADPDFFQQFEAWIHKIIDRVEHKRYLHGMASARDFESPELLDPIH